MKLFCILAAGRVFIFLAFAAVAAFSAEKPWVEVHTEHFSVITDVNEKRAAEVAGRCEQMRAAFLVLMNRATTEDPAPLLIFALNGQREVEEMLNGGHGKSRHAGIFLPGLEQNFILLDASEDPWSAVFHEYAHELLNANRGPNMQTWFEEGFAEYFSTFEARPGKFQIGRVPLRELQFLRKNGKLMRFSDLAGVTQNSRIYTENGPAQELFYAESWLLVHYLFDHQLIGRVQPFFSLIAAGAPLDAAVQQAFGMSTQKMESELLDYARGEKFRYFALPLRRDSSAEVASSAPLTDVSVTALKTEVRWQATADHSRKEADQYASEYKFLLAREPGNLTALRGMGQIERKLRNDEDVRAAGNQPLSAH